MSFFRNGFSRMPFFSESMILSFSYSVQVFDSINMSYILWGRNDGNYYDDNSSRAAVTFR